MCFQVLRSGEHRILCTCLHTIMRRKNGCTAKVSVAHQRAAKANSTVSGEQQTEQASHNSEGPSHQQGPLQLVRLADADALAIEKCSAATRGRVRPGHPRAGSAAAQGPFAVGACSWVRAHVDELHYIVTAVQQGAADVLQLWWLLNRGGHPMQWWRPHLNSTTTATTGCALCSSPAQIGIGRNTHL